MVLGYGGMKRYAKKGIFLKPQHRVIALVNIRYFRKDICVFADDPPSLSFINAEVTSLDKVGGPFWLSASKHLTSKRLKSDTLRRCYITVR